MAELIDPTWLAWHAESPGEAPARERLERVRRHYAKASEAPLEVRSWATGPGEAIGIATIADPSPAHRWSHFTADAEIAVATAYLPWGWRALRDVAIGKAPIALGRAILDAPDRVAAELDPPMVIGVADKRRGRVVIANDRLRAGRLYEGRFGALTVWSNRGGAIPIFAASPPRASERGWALFAAAGWFIRDTTSLEGISRVDPGAVIEIAPDRISRRHSETIGPLADRRNAPFEELVERFVSDARAAARAAAELFEAPVEVDLSGGRDSRLAAAAVLAARAPAKLLTSDMTPGEAEVARDLVGRLDAPVPHQVRWGGEERKVYEHGVRERAGANHLIHDGMRHAAKVRGKMTLPAARPAGASVTGHGGEIAHGFYYTNDRQLAEIEAGGSAGALARLEQAARRRHAAGTSGAYELFRTEAEAALGEASAIGLEGPALLDWFYLTERFAHRSGLAADATRLTFFARAPFVAAAFALSPAERLEAKLHTEAIAALEPAWAGVPFFAKSKPRRSPLARLRRRRLPSERRELIWEGDDAAAVKEMLIAGGPWEQMFDPERARELWSAAQAGRGDAHYQDVFEGIAYRVAFEDHLATLAAAARG